MAKVLDVTEGKLFAGTRGVQGEPGGHDKKALKCKNFRLTAPVEMLIF